MFFRRTSTTIIFCVALATIVLATPPTIVIQPQATLIVGAVIVRVDVNCGPGESVAVLLVGVRQGDFATENVVEFPSNGDRQEVEVTVVGPFESGDAVASAQLACSLLLTGERLGVPIKISE